MGTKCIMNLRNIWEDLKMAAINCSVECSNICHQSILQQQSLSRKVSLDYFWPIFLLTNKRRLMRTPCCLCVCESLLLTFECPNQSLWIFVYMMVSEPPQQRTSYPCNQSVCTCILPTIARQRFRKVCSFIHC